MAKKETENQKYDRFARHKGTPKALREKMIKNKEMFGKSFTDTFAAAFMGLVRNGVLDKAEGCQKASECFAKFEERRK